MEKSKDKSEAGSCACDTKMCGMIKDCMAKCGKWGHLVPAVFGFILLVLGVLLSASAIKGLWIIISIGFIALGGWCFFNAQGKCKSD